MPEPELPQQADVEVGDVLKQLELVRPVADAQAQAIDVPDTRALEGQDRLFVEGDRWERHRNKQLFRARIFLLLALFMLVVVWLISIPGLMLMLGYHWKGFSLSDAVAIAYMTTTTVSVIGLFKIAATWLFSDVKPSPSSKEEN
jgi:hypothetical protein